MNLFQTARIARFAERVFFNRLSRVVRSVAAAGIVAALVAAAAPDARAVAEIATSLPLGPPGVPGSQFSVLVRVRQNNTGLVPRAFNFRFSYLSTAIELLSASPGELGTPTYGPIQGTPPNVYRDISTPGAPGNNEIIPDCFTLTFRVVKANAGVFAIEISDGPVGIPLLAKDGSASIPHSFDNGATTNLGEPRPPQPNPLLEYTFAESVNGWRFIVSPAFAAPDSAYFSSSGGVLAVRSANNTACFGFWESPVIDLSPADSLFTVEYFVRPLVSSPAKSPQIRFRSSSSNLQQSRFMTVESRADGLASPGSTGTAYTLLLSPGSSAEEVRTEFELLNFDPQDDADGIYYLDYVRFTRRDPAQIVGRVPVQSFTFGSGSEGWASHTTPVFSAPVLRADPGSLVLEGNGRADAFGYWTSPELPGGLPPASSAFFAADSHRPLYIATFAVESTLPIGDRSRNPQFRLRLNEIQGRAAAYMAIESRGEALLSPISGAPRQYVVYFLPPTTLSEASLVASIDYLNFDAADHATASLKLNDFSLEVAPYPW